MTEDEMVGWHHWRQRREGGGHQLRDGCLEPPEAGRGGKDPPLEPLQGAQRQASLSITSSQNLLKLLSIQRTWI